MENANSTPRSNRRERKGVLPSGVPFEIYGMTGDDLDTIAKAAEGKKTNWMSDLLKSCVKSVGDVVTPSSAFFDSMLELDLRFILLAIRQLSQRDSKEFIFDYQFPMQNKQRIVETVRFNMEPADFLHKPFKWVLDRMIADYKALQADAGVEVEEADLAEVLLKDGQYAPYPVMYESYNDMLAQHLRHSFTLPDAGTTINYELITHDRATKFSNALGDKKAKYTDLVARYKPTYLYEGNTPSAFMANSKSVSAYDVEKLHIDMREKDAKIDTLVVVESEKKPGLQAQIDVITIPAFFYPSLAK